MDTYIKVEITNNYETRARSPLNNLGKMKNIEAFILYRKILVYRPGMVIGVQKLRLLNAL